MTNLLLASGGYGSPARKTLLKKALTDFFTEPSALLLIPYALNDHPKSLNHWQSLLGDVAHIESLHQQTNPQQAIEQTDGFIIEGGNTFRLINELHQQACLGAIRERVHAGTPYFGVSAGANVACPTMQTTNDMPIVQPPSFEALNLVPFQINAHYFSGHHYVKNNDNYIEHFGETRDRRINEFHQMNNTPVVGLEEAGMLRIRDANMTLQHAKARLFLPNQAHQDFNPGDDMSFLLA